MAFVPTLRKQGVCGDLKYRSYGVVFTAVTTGAITTDLSTIKSVAYVHDTDESYTVVPADVANASTVTFNGVTAGATGLVFIEGT